MYVESCCCCCLCDNNFPYGRFPLSLLRLTNTVTRREVSFPTTKHFPCTHVKAIFHISIPVLYEWESAERGEREKQNSKRSKGSKERKKKKLIKTQHIFAIFLYSCKLNNNDSLRNDLKVNWLWGRVEMRQAENDGLLTAANCYLLTCSEHCVRPTMTAVGGVKLGEE